MYIEGLSIGGFRSLGERQRLGPLQKVNLLIGPNNSGKSNVLLFLKNHFGKAIQVARGNAGSSGYKFEAIDHHLGHRTLPFVFGLAMSVEGPAFTQIAEKVSSIPNLFKQILYSQCLSNGTGLAWFEYEASAPGQTLNISSKVIDTLKNEEIFAVHDWQRVWNTLTKSSGGGLTEHWIPETLRALSPVGIQYPNVSFVPAIRQISDSHPGGDEKTTDQELSGKGLIGRLARLERPAYNRQDDKQRFDAINEFLRTVTENPSATLEIPFERDMIIVHMDGKSLPLTSLGTGIHEVVILAAAATVIENQIVCIEEPELHLHPRLQRILIRYLIERTSNQYFITTHSAHLLEVKDTAIIRIRLEDGQTKTSLASSVTDKWEVCRDLGYRASDILQTNCVIWVEGPSDRIYLNHWIKAVAPDLIEGIQYSIMFYGGRLLCHLSANDPEVDEFISLRRLNRNLVIVADSDKDSSHKWINATKKRVRDEFNDGPGFAWITKGREIENYVEPRTLRHAVEKVRPGMGANVVENPYLRALPFINPRAKNSVTVDKIKVAREVAAQPARLDGILDLKQRVCQLVEFIKESNG